MNAVATHATHVRSSVCGSIEIRMRRGVALQALAIDCFRRRLVEQEECFKAAASCLYMFSARPMAALAGNTFAAMYHREAGVRILRELLAYLVVTSFAGFCPNKVSGVGDACLFIDGGLLLIGGGLLLTVSCSVHRHGFPEAEQGYDERHTEEQPSHASLRQGGLQSYSAYSFRAHCDQT